MNKDRWLLMLFAVAGLSLVSIIGYMYVKPLLDLILSFI